MLKGKIAVLPEVDMAMLNKEYKANLEKIKSSFLFRIFLLSYYINIMNFFFFF